MAKQSMSPLEKVKSTIESLTNRLDKAEQKHRQAVTDGNTNADALALGVEKLKEKLANAQKELAELEPAATDNSDKANSDKAKAESDNSATIDPAQAAIERAKAKAIANASMTPKQKLEDQIISLKSRIEKTQAKYDAAVKENSDKQEAFATGLEKLKQKLEAAEQELAQL
jgi:electron transport complex protein RnfC